MQLGLFCIKPLTLLRARIPTESGMLMLLIETRFDFFYGYLYFPQEQTKASRMQEDYLQYGHMLVVVLKITSFCHQLMMLANSNYSDIKIYVDMAIFNTLRSEHFLEWKSLYCDSNFTEVCSYGSNKSLFIQVMAWRNRRQVITLTTDGTVHWCHMASLMPSLGHNELTHWGRDKMGAISQTTFLSAFSWMKNFEF